MKISEIYALEPIKIKHDLGLIIESIKAIIDDNYDARSFELETLIQAWEFSYEHEHMIDQTRYEIRMYMDESDDYDKYGARLFSIYFENIPMMLVQNNGRYFDTYSTYLTNKEQLQKFAEYLISLAKNFTEDHELNTYSADEDIQNIEQIDHYNLFNYYDANLQTKYKIDDLVWAWVPENHLTYQYSEEFIGYVLTKVKITLVNKLNPTCTYLGSQRERGWERNKDHTINHVMKLYPIDSPEVGIGCELNDSLILGKVDEIPMPEMAINNNVDIQGFLNQKYKMKFENIPN